MKYRSFIEKLLENKDSYWVVSRQNYIRQYFEEKRTKDDIIFIAIPKGVERPKDLLELTIKELDSLISKEIIENIYLNGNYPPFQWGLRVDDLSDGFPIETHKGVAVRTLIKEFFDLDSDNLNDYENLYKDFLEQINREKEGKE